MQTTKQRDDRVRVDVPVTKKEREAWAEKAHAQGLTLAEWIRQRCNAPEPPKAEA